MNNWIFFPPAKEDNFSARDFLIMLGLDNGPTREEWHEFLPESRMRVQRPSLAFSCGNGGKLPDLHQGLPEFPVRNLVDFYLIQPLAWQTNTVYTSSVSSNNDYRLACRRAPAYTITVSGMLLKDCSISIWGGPLTRFSPYVFDKNLRF